MEHDFELVKRLFLESGHGHRFSSKSQGDSGSRGPADAPGDLPARLDSAEPPRPVVVKAP